MRHEESVIRTAWPITSWSSRRKVWQDRFVCMGTAVVVVVVVVVGGGAAPQHHLSLPSERSAHQPCRQPLGPTRYNSSPSPAGVPGHSPTTSQSGSVRSATLLDLRPWTWLTRGILVSTVITGDPTQGQARWNQRWVELVQINGSDSEIIWHFLHL